MLKYAQIWLEQDFAICFIKQELQFHSIVLADPIILYLLGDIKSLICICVVRKSVLHSWLEILRRFLLLLLEPDRYMVEGTQAMQGTWGRPCNCNFGCWKCIHCFSLLKPSMFVRGGLVGASSASQECYAMDLVGWVRNWIEVHEMA